MSSVRLRGGGTNVPDCCFSTAGGLSADEDADEEVDDDSDEGVKGAVLDVGLSGLLFSDELAELSKHK